MSKTMKVAGISILVILVAVSFLPMVSTDAGSQTVYPDEGIVIPYVDLTQDTPSSIDLRDYGLVTSVKDQGNNGTCWSFAASSVIETAMLKKRLATLDGLEVAPLQIAYFSANKTVDLDGGTAGDMIIPTDERSYLDLGGEAILTTMEYATWMGPVTTGTLNYPYSEATATTTFDESLEYSSDCAHLVDAKWVNANDLASVKYLVSQGNSGVIGFYFVNGNMGMIASQTEGTNLTYCGHDDEIPNHEVTIIGYDDNYPASNFVNAPAGNGAWLCKNSWGPDVGNDGCFWLSYYDESVRLVVFFFVESADNYDHNYEYDGGGSTNNNMTLGPEGYMANAFTASGDQVLKAVSFFMMQNSNVDYTVRIYKDLKDPNDPTSGKVVSTISGKTDCAGYYTIPLSTAVDLDKGETFSVVVYGVSSGGEDLYLPIDTDEVRSMSGLSWITYDTFASTGQSFISSDGSEWTDIGSDGSSNVRIKAFTDDISDSSGNPYIWAFTGVIIILMLVATALVFLVKRRPSDP